jgi:hypothetical protein
MNTIDVTPIEIRDYALSYGWTLVREAIRDGLFILNSPNQRFKQLVFPIEGSLRWRIRGHMKANTKCPEMPRKDKKEKLSKNGKVH